MVKYNLFNLPPVDNSTCVISYTCYIYSIRATHKTLLKNKMKNIIQRSVIRQSNGNRFAVTRVLDENRFFAIWIGNNNFSDKTTFNAFMDNGDFRTANVLFRRTKNGFRRVNSIGGMAGLVNNSESRNLLDVLDSLN